MSRGTKRQKWAGDVIVAFFLLAVAVLRPFSYLEYKLQDYLYQRPASVQPDIIVIGIDEEALAMFGPAEQWSRQVMADALNILNGDGEDKPAVIALDVLYAGESGEKAADENLAKAAEKGGNVVLAANAIVGLIQSPQNEYRTIRAVVDYETPYPALARYATYGFVNPVFDEDGVIRNAALAYPYAGQTIRSFPMEICKAYSGDFAFGTAGVAQGRTETYITYSDMPGAYKQFSFADLFKEDFDPGYLADCIVLIGSYSPGNMDAYYTAISADELMYGVEIHANVVQMLLEGNLKQYASPHTAFALFLSLVFVCMVLARILEIRVLLVSFTMLAAGYVFAALRLFTHGYILSLIYPVAALIFIYLYRLVYGYILETLEKRRIRETFKKYVDPKLADQLVESGEANSSEVGVEKDIAVLFVDVRGFTPMTEALTDQPGLVVKILNEYLELTTEAIFTNGGSIDKFIGDATMGLFNGFFPLEDYAYKAVKAAWDMISGAAEVNRSIKEKYGVDVGFGVGVNCGKAIVGNLGPSFRKDYTAIGDTVNTAARLESNAERSQVLISKDVYDRIRDRVTAESVGEILLKGKSEKLEVFSVTQMG